MESCAQASLRDSTVNGERTGLGVSSASESTSAPGSCPTLAKSLVLLENSTSSSSPGLLSSRSRQCLHWDLFLHTLTQVPEPLSPVMDPQGLSSWSWPSARWTCGAICLLLPACTDLSLPGLGHWSVHCLDSSSALLPAFQSHPSSVPLESRVRQGRTAFLSLSSPLPLSFLLCSREEHLHPPPTLHQCALPPFL